MIPNSAGQQGKSRLNYQSLPLSFGFTLLEVLVALVIASLVAGWLLYVLSHYYSGNRAYREMLTFADQVNPFFDYLKNELKENRSLSQIFQNLNDPDWFKEFIDSKHGEIKVIDKIKSWEGFLALNGEEIPWQGNLWEIILSRDRSTGRIILILAGAKDQVPEW